MKKSKFGNVVLCERVFPGERNKHMLLNTYSGDIMVGEMPGALFFGLYMEIYASASNEENVHLEVLIDDNILLEGQAKVTVGRSGDMAVLTLPTFIANFQKNGILTIRVTQDGMQPTIALKKRVFKADLPA